MFNFIFYVKLQKIDFFYLRSTNQNFFLKQKKPTEISRES